MLTALRLRRSRVGVTTTIISVVLRIRTSRDGNQDTTRSKNLRAPFELPRTGRARWRLSQHAPVAPHRRQGSPAQAPEQDLLPDIRRGSRGGSHRGRNGSQTRLRLVLSVLSRSGSLSQARRHAGRDALLRGWRRERSGVGWTADAESLGPQGLQHRLGVFANRYAVSAVGRVSRGDASREADWNHRGVQGRRSCTRYDGRGTDQRGRVLGIAQQRDESFAACRLSRRRQRLRDLGSGRSEHRRRKHLEAGALLPEPAGGGSGRLRFHRELRRDVSRSGARPREKGGSSRARQGDSSVLALAVRRRNDVSPAGRA